MFAPHILSHSSALEEFQCYSILLSLLFFRISSQAWPALIRSQLVLCLESLTLMPASKQFESFSKKSNIRRAIELYESKERPKKHPGLTFFQDGEVVRFPGMDRNSNSSRKYVLFPISSIFRSLS